MTITCVFLETTETVLLAPEFPSVWDRLKKFIALQKSSITKLRESDVR